MNHDIHGQCPSEVITLKTQKDVDDFHSKYPECTDLKNNLYIDSRSTSKSQVITNLRNLNSINSIDGTLIIYATELKDLKGLDSLKIIKGSLDIQINDSLRNLNGLNNLNRIGKHLELSYNSNLKDISQLIQLEEVTGQINLSYLSIESLYGLGNINPSTISELYVNGLENLKNIYANNICDFIKNGNSYFSLNSSGFNSTSDISNKCNSETIAESAPVLAPHNIYRGIRNNQVILNWDANSEVNLAGYRVYKKNKITNEFELLTDVGKSIFWASSEFNSEDEYGVSAYNLAADGLNDIEEGNESKISTDVISYFSFKNQSEIEICKGDQLEVEVISNISHFKNEYFLQLFSKENLFEPINLDTVKNESEIFRSELSDTFQISEKYDIRIYSRLFDLYSESLSFKLKPLPEASFDLQSEVCQNTETVITFSGTSSNNTSNFYWNFNDAIISSGTGQGPYELMWQSDGEKSIKLEVVENGCSSIVENQIHVKKTPTSHFYSESQICDGDSLIVTYSGSGSDTANYTWDFGDASFIEGENSGPYKLAWDSFGNKKIMLSVEENGCTSPFELKEITYSLYPNILLDAKNSVCYNDFYHVNFLGDNFSNIFWDFDGASFVTGSESGPYLVNWNFPGKKAITIQVENFGCFADTTVSVDIPDKPFIPELCIVTVDEEFSKNKLIWQYELSSASQFGIYRETNVSGQYALIDYISSDLNHYIDEQSSPEQQSNRYKMTCVDTCGTETELSNFHKTIHLTINKGVGKNWNLIWDGYEGFPFGTYRIYRSVNNQDFILLTEIASNLNSYTDTDVLSLNVAYQIEVVSPNNCNISNDGRILNEITTSKSNIAKSNIILNASRSNLEIFPNPVTEKITISNLDNYHYQSYEIVSLTGKVIQTGQITIYNEIYLNNIHAGVYLLKVNHSEGQLVYKILKD